MPKTKSSSTEPKKADNDMCPKCGAPLSPVTETPTGKRLQRCSKGSWNPQTRQNEGCDYVKWLETPPQTLEENCPKCGAPLLMITTRFGKKAKKCSTSGWDRATKQATGCTYIEWLNDNRPSANNGDENFPSEPI